MFKLLKPYVWYILVISLLSVGANVLSLFFPQKIGQYIDLYATGNFDMHSAVFALVALAFSILIISFVQSSVATYASDKIGFNLRNQIISTLKNRSFTYMRQVTSGRLITTLTSDVDAIENLLGQGIIALLSATVTLIGVIIFLLVINWKLALVTLAVLPFIVLVFFLVFRKLGPLFGMSQGNLDKINKVINESIVASALVRVLNSVGFEMSKFDVVNKRGTNLSQMIVKYFAALIPILTLLSNASLLAVLYFGGKGVISGAMTVGQMSAFFSYTSVFIWPFFILSFGGTFISRAQVSWKRIEEVLNAEEAPHNIPSIKGARGDFVGHIVFKNVTLSYGDKVILKDISFEIKPHTKTAIIGPTGAGKTELFYLLAGLAKPTEGQILIDGLPYDQWNTSDLLSNIGMVFQDSIIFNTTFKENVMFKKADSLYSNVVLNQSLDVAELQGLVKDLPDGLETNVSERGTSLSGGQKQRLMLARALAIEPKVLLLDDFTARVDAGTEERILQNIQNTFPDITLVSITQKIEPIKNYDHVIVLMEGELIGQGKHEELLKTSLEYRQIYESQKSTEN